ncbi:MAG TPA: hypothetical protein VGJ75_25500 [Dongiaceae bacterium]|jgi:hypothetical protein
MTRVMLLAVLDTLLPGDDGEPPLPSATEAALDLKKLERLAEPVAAALGDGDEFLMTSPAERVAKLRIVELNAPDAFKALLAEAMATYYEAAPVLAALGWRAAPPQPHGHDVAPDDPATLQALEKVKRRGPLWRH